MDYIYKCVKNIDYEDDDDSDIYFVDFLTKSEEIVDFGDEYYYWLKDFRIAIVNGLNRYSKSSEEYYKLSPNEKQQYKNIFKKYRWMMKYWNSVVLNDDAYFPVPDIDEEYQMAFREQYRQLRINMRYPY